jgi:hypothetical protein
VRFQRLFQSFQQIWKGHAGLAGAGGQRGQDALLAEQISFDHVRWMAICW